MPSLGEVQTLVVVHASVTDKTSNTQHSFAGQYLRGGNISVPERQMDMLADLCTTAMAKHLWLQAKAPLTSSQVYGLN